MTTGSRQVETSDVLWMVLPAVAGAALRFHHIGTTLAVRRDRHRRRVRSLSARRHRDTVRRRQPSPALFAARSRSPSRSSAKALGAAAAGPAVWCRDDPVAVGARPRSSGRLEPWRRRAGPDRLVSPRLVLAERARLHGPVFFVLLSTYALLRWLDTRRQLVRAGCSSSARRSALTRI